MEKVTRFINLLKANFTQRFESPEQELEWTKSMLRELRGFDPVILERAATDIIRTRKYRNFPMPAECLEACFHAKKAAENLERSSFFDLSKSKPADGKRAATFESLADELILGPMGRQAAREDWIGFLYDFIKKNGRLPKDGEAALIKAEVVLFDEKYRDCVRGKGGAAGKILIELGDKFLKRRKELTDRVLHGVIS
jgi:hypothetical protein